MKRLMNKIAIITGGASGIGFEAARIFLREGAEVIIADLHETKGEQAVKNLMNEVYPCTFLKVDVSDRQSVQRLIKNVIHQHGKIDILINNAGINSDAMLVNMTEDDFKNVLDVNLTGVFHCTQEVASIMIEQKYGKIINTTSVSGVFGNIGQTNYAAAKAGIIGMTKSWAKELGQKGIHVNAVAPGFTKTDMVKDVPENVIKQMMQQIPLKRLGNPKEIANAYLFLASDESSYVNGHILHVDGGIMM